jgi:hypothetical protein
MGMKVAVNLYAKMGVRNFPEYGVPGSKTFGWRLKVSATRSGLFPRTDGDTGRFAEITNPKSKRRIVASRSGDTLADTKCFHVESRGFESEDSARADGARFRECLIALDLIYELGLICSMQDSGPPTESELLRIQNEASHEMVSAEIDGLFCFAEEVGLSEFVA